MKALIAALLMMGPFATEADIDQARRTYARATYDCGIWIAGDVRGKKVEYTEIIDIHGNIWAKSAEIVHKNPRHGNISNMTIGPHDVSWICIDDGAADLIVTGIVVKGSDKP